MNSGVDVEEHIAVVAAEGKRLLDAAQRTGWDAQVPTCPEWTVRDLVRLRFWARRQAHETTVHRVDAESAAGKPSAITPAVAADGIDEVMHGMFARRPSRFRSDEPYSFTLAATDVDRSWLVRVAEDGCTAVDGEKEGTVVRADAGDLYLLVWNRRPLEGLQVEGDPTGLAHWRANANIRWAVS